jgi:hypothetical protein
MSAEFPTSGMEMTQILVVSDVERSAAYDLFQSRGAQFLTPPTQ